MTPPAIMQVFKAFIQRRGKLSDIEFLAIKEFGGKLRQNDNVRATTGDGATLTANTGKDMYLAYAQATCYATTPTSAAFATVTLNINGVVYETWNWQSGPNTAGAKIEGSFKFSVGYKVATTQIIKLEVTSDTNATVSTAIQCFEEDTSGSPQI